MRYQAYKNKMIKIRKVIDFFYRFRFVFIGAAVVIAATITTLDLTKGNITEVSKFDVSYNYGDDISYSGSAFMGKVTFEFRRKGEKDWTEEEPYLAGEYEARGKSQGSHGYKYTDISTFEIKPLNLSLDLLSKSIDFGNDHPAINYDHNALINGDKLLEDAIKVNYASLETRTTTANFDMSTVKVEDSKGRDVTSCYIFDVPKDVEITFNKAPLKIDFVQKSPFEYTGDIFSNNEYQIKNGHLFYDAHLEMTGGKSGSAIDVYDNTGEHSFRVVDDEGHDYTANYDISITENSFEIEQAAAVTITSANLNKTYDGKPFEEFNDPDSLITVSPKLIKGHHFKLLGFTNENLYLTTANEVTPLKNEFTYDIVDDEGNSVDRTLYKSITPVYGSFNINKRRIAITSSSNTYDFDSTAHSLPTIDSIGGDGLAAGDEIEISSSTSQTAKTSSSGVNNVLTYKIKRGTSYVTDSYDCYGNETWGKIVVNQMKLKFDFASFPVTYDGANHPYYKANGNYEVYDTEAKRENAAVLASGYSLPYGWKYDVRLNTYGSYYRKYYKANGYQVSNNDVQFDIWNNSGINVSSYFDVGTDITFSFDSVNINKKYLEVTVEDYNKVFDNQTISYDFSVDSSLMNARVTYTGLVSGDLPDVKFDGETANVKNASTTPYNLSLTYGVKNSSGDNLTNNYDIHFTNNKEVMKGTIAKKDINVIPNTVYKYYDGTNVFTPATPTCTAVSTPLIGETVSFKTQGMSTYTTSSASKGNYTYKLNKNDLVIKVNGQDVTSNYNIFCENSGSVEVSPRPLNISSTSKSQSGSYIWYDNQNHGVFTDDGGYSYSQMDVPAIGGYSSEISIETSNAENTRGLVAGQRIVIDKSTLKIKEPDYLEIGQYDDLGIRIYNSSNIEVTSNYTFTHDPFFIKIVKPKVYINPYTVEKYFDGGAFELDALRNVPFSGDDAYLNFNSNEMQLLYNCDFTYDLNDGYGERDYLSLMTQRGHTLKLTKYTLECANGANIYNPLNDPEDGYGNPVYYNDYPFYYDYKVVDNSGNDVSVLYDFVAPQGLNKLRVRRAEISISCTGGSKYYDGQICTTPADQYPLTTDKSASAYIVSANVGSMFSSYYMLRAKFNTDAYTQEQIANMYKVGVYNFGVTITIHRPYQSGDSGYAMDAISSIKITLLKDYYEYEVVQTSLTITTTKVLSDGRSIRKASGLKSGDKVRFYDADGFEEMTSSLYKYTKPINQVKVYRGSVDVTGCYNISTP